MHQFIFFFQCTMALPQENLLYCRSGSFGGITGKNSYFTPAEEWVMSKHTQALSLILSPCSLSLPLTAKQTKIPNGVIGTVQILCIKRSSTPSRRNAIFHLLCFNTAYANISTCITQNSILWFRKNALTDLQIRLETGNPCIFPEMYPDGHS